MKKKILSLLGVSLTMSIFLSSTSLAGQWQQDSKGWWYQEDNGSYQVNDWKEIEGKRYHFNQKGYMDIGWKKINTTKVENRQDGTQYSYDTDLWYLFDASGTLVTEGNWDGGAIGPDGALCIDNTKYENGELFYQRSWSKGLPAYLGAGKEYEHFGNHYGLEYNFYSCSLPWKQELANLIDATIGNEMGTFTIDYQLPETWSSECPKPLMSEMIRKVALSKVEYVNESQERSWEIDSNNIIHITIKRDLTN